MYRNSVDPETKSSPAMILFGRPIRDAIPIIMGKYLPHETWREITSHRELALAKRHCRAHERWSEHTKALPPPKVGDHVYLQNLVGNNPTRWERTGVVIEVRQYHQYAIRVDGSGRVTLRNRQHLRKFTPFKSATPSQDLPHPTPPCHQSEPEYSTPVAAPPEVLPPDPVIQEERVTPPVQNAGEPSGLDNTILNDGAQQVVPDTPNDASPRTPAVRIPAVQSPKIPRALQRLLPHNAAGLEEEKPSTRPRRGGRERP